ncbi:hypothetical protein ACE4ZV_26250, partial [Salmonella enterica]|uniref:hypothetical protein n=1 Tax=Salmonella enterica TaxID=28901 RepID=UPI003D26E888
TDDLASVEDALATRSAEIEAEILRASGSGGRYSAWLEATRNMPGTVMERAIQWRLLQILVVRDLRKAQSSFDFDALTVEEFESRAGSGTDRAAEHF